MPNQIAQPEISAPDPAQAGKMKARYALNGKAVIYGESFSGSSAILPFETNQVGLQSKIMALRGAYVDRQAWLLKQMDGASNIQFGGILVAAAGIAAKEIGLRNTGAGAAGLSTLWTNHYQLSIQAANYGLAAQGMNCLHKEISALPASFWYNAYSPEGVFEVAQGDLGMASTPAEESAAYDALSRMYLLLHDAVDNVDQKLRALQSGVTIAKVSVADIQGAATFQNEADATGKAIGSDATKGAASASALSAAAAAAQADAAAKLSEAHAEAAKQVAEEAIGTVENARVDARRALHTLKEAEIELSEFQSKNNGRSTDKTRAEEKQLLARRDTAQRLVDAGDKKVVKRENELHDAQKTAGIYAAQAGRDRSTAVRAMKVARQKEVWENLVASGIASRAVQLPAKANACVVAMGK